MNIFDIVIPVGPNDISVINEQIKYTKKNIIGYRNIYLICYDPSINIDGCVTINENIFPFNIYLNSSKFICYTLLCFVRTKIVLPNTSFLRICFHIFTNKTC